MSGVVTPPMSNFELLAQQVTRVLAARWGDKATITRTGTRIRIESPMFLRRDGRISHVRTEDTVEQLEPYVSKFDVIPEPT